MKLPMTLFVAALLAASLQQLSNAGTTPTQASGQSMPMKTDAIATKASATGIVKVVDVAAGKITISHGPVAAVNWPAMTMAFKATPAQLAAVHVGQKVDFEFMLKGMDGTLTRIVPIK